MTSLLWPKVRLDECCAIVSGATPSTTTSAYWNGDICWVTPKDLSGLIGSYISDTPRKVTREGLESCTATVLPANSVLFSSRAPIGHVAINAVPMATNQGFKSLIPKPEKLEVRYLYWWLRAKRSYLESLGNGATFKEVSKSVVARVEIPLPPLNYQRSVAEVLDRVDTLRANRRESLTRLESLSQSLFIDMFGAPIENPRGFPVRSLVELVDPRRPVCYGILMPGPDQLAGVKYVRVVDMKRGGVELSGIRKTTEEISSSYRRSLLKTGDLLMSIRGHVGRLAIVPPELEDANITQDTARLAIVGASTSFVRECLRTISMQHWMAKHTKGIAVQGINLGDVKKMPIVVPSEAAQLEFADKVAAVDRLIFLQYAAIAKVDALFDSLQHRAFRGEL